VTRDLERLQLDKVGPGREQVVGGIRGHEPVIVAVQDENGVAELIRSRNDIEAIERDR
tara:strand:+ start:326 stop:499 length:174 start_codon:yes stop_codon:yes gene_type:complete